jgi:uncharacterized membrane protein YbhN (UPF0104 family)
MNAKQAAKSLFKLLVTVGIFVGIFAEFGGGRVEVDRAALLDGSALYRPNPAMPGVVGKVQAKLKSTALPEPLVPMGAANVCRVAAEGPVFVRTTAGATVKFKALRHCEQDQLATAFASAAAEPSALASLTTPTVFVLKQGFQLVPMDMQDLWREIRSVELGLFLPWFLFAMAIKLVGIFANVYRWQVLLAGQGISLGFGWLSASYFVGRYFGIVTPSTMGLDGWRLYDTIRLTRRPVECTTALAVERVIGLVGLLAVILGFMPFANLGGRDLAEIMSAMKVPIAAGVFFGVLLLLQPAWFLPLVRIVPGGKARGFLKNAIESATAYGANRRALLVALACAVFGQLTTMFMYFGNAKALGVEGVPAGEILYASAVMTLGTFLAPSASGEGVRELVFVALLGGRTTAAKAFLIGHLGFWIEKLPLSLPGGWFLLRAPEAYKRVTADDLARLRAETAAAAPTS